MRAIIAAVCLAVFFIVTVLSSPATFDFEQVAETDLVSTQFGDETASGATLHSSGEFTASSAALEEENQLAQADGSDRTDDEVYTEIGARLDECASLFMDTGSDSGQKEPKLRRWLDGVREKIAEIKKLEGHQHDLTELRKSLDVTVTDATKAQGAKRLCKGITDAVIMQCGGAQQKNCKPKLWLSSFCSTELPPCQYEAASIVSEAKAKNTKDAIAAGLEAIFAEQKHIRLKLESEQESVIGRFSCKLLRQGPVIGYSCLKKLRGQETGGLMCKGLDQHVKTQKCWLPHSLSPAEQEAGLTGTFRERGLMLDGDGILKRVIAKQTKCIDKVDAKGNLMKDCTEKKASACRKKGRSCPGDNGQLLLF